MSNLTLKQRKFVAGVASGLPKRSAAIQAGYSERSAHTIAYENMNKHEVQKSIESIMQENGISDDFIAYKLMELAEAETNGNPQWAARARALDMMLKVKGYYSQEIETPRIQMTIEQAQAKIEALLTTNILKL